MKRAEHVARIGEMRNAFKILVDNLKGRDHLEDLAVDGRIILKWILNKWGRRVCTGLIWQE
jgi:hypothetical protein